MRPEETRHRPMVADPALPRGNSCPKCNGTGQIIELIEVDLYGGEKVPYASPCPVCSGRRRTRTNTGVPPEYLETDISKFDFTIYSRDLGKLKQLCENFITAFQKWEANGKGLYLWSTTPGSGKTFLACSLARSAMIRNNISMRFVTAPDYIAAVGDSFKRERGTEDPTEIYRTCKLLILDDIGAQKDGDWQRQEFFRLINTRMEQGNITIFTSNSAPEDLKIDDRIKSRIIKSAIVLQMPEESIRERKAYQEQTDFLNGIWS